MAAGEKTEKPKAEAKPKAPPVDFDKVLKAATDGIFDAVVPKASHTRLEIGGKQVVYAEKRRTGASLVIASRLITDDSLKNATKELAWHGGRSILLVEDNKQSVNTARRLLKHVVKNFADQAKGREAAKAETAEARKAKAKAAREEKQAAKAQAKADAEGNGSGTA